MNMREGLLLAWFVFGLIIVGVGAFRVGVHLERSRHYTYMQDGWDRITEVTITRSPTFDDFAATFTVERYRGTKVKL